MEYPKSEVYLQDCMEGMKRYPDKYFDLAIVDPPYGIKQDGKSNHSRKGKAKATQYAAKEWDRYKPDSSYFKELFRVSKNQIIWGGNYFVEHLPSSMCWIFWDKQIGASFSDGEFAFTSFNTRARKFIYTWNGFRQGENCQSIEPRIHPTQKPVALYKWLLENYATTGNKILDTHMGSQSSRIAAYKMGFNYTGFELDADYFKAGCQRFELEIQKQELFTPKQINPLNGDLFAA